jgi:hypothetical protein
MQRAIQSASMLHTHMQHTHAAHTHMQHTHMDLACASQVIEGAGSRQTVQRSTNVLQEAQGDDIEPEEDWATLPLQGALPYLCKESPNFRGVLAEIARSQGRCNASPPCMQLQRCGYNRTSACSVIADHANSPCIHVRRAPVEYHSLRRWHNPWRRVLAGQ